jgi:hypothetical protein
MPRANLMMAASAVMLIASTLLFVVTWRNPDLIDLGPRLRPAAIGVVGAAFSFFSLLVAFGLRNRKP